MIHDDFHVSILVPSFRQIAKHLFLPSNCGYAIAMRLRQGLAKYGCCRALRTPDITTDTTHQEPSLPRDTLKWPGACAYARGFGRFETYRIKQCPLVCEPSPIPSSRYFTFVQLDDPGQRLAHDLPLSLLMSKISLGNDYSTGLAVLFLQNISTHAGLKKSARHQECPRCTASGFLFNASPAVSGHSE